MNAREWAAMVAEAYTRPRPHPVETPFEYLASKAHYQAQTVAGYTGSEKEWVEYVRTFVLATPGWVPPPSYTGKLPPPPMPRREPLIVEVPTALSLIVDQIVREGARPPPPGWVDPAAKPQLQLPVASSDRDGRNQPLPATVEKTGASKPKPKKPQPQAEPVVPLGSSFELSPVEGPPKSLEEHLAQAAKERPAFIPPPTLYTEDL